MAGTIFFIAFAMFVAVVLLLAFGAYKLASEADKESEELLAVLEGRKSDG